MGGQCIGAVGKQVMGHNLATTGVSLKDGPERSVTVFDNKISRPVQQVNLEAVRGAEEGDR